MHGFRPAVPARAAASLDQGVVHVWRLPYRVDQRRLPFRQLVAAYLGVRADRVVFRDAPGGRPAIHSPASDLSVNWSHSGTHAVLAIARGLEQLGVDFEQARPRPRAADLARRFFHADECAALSMHSGDALESAFLKLWTSKEAVLKAIGAGLSHGLDRVVFRFAGNAIVPARFDGTAGTAADWTLRRVDDPLGHVSVAWRGAERAVQWLSWEPAEGELSPPSQV